MPSTGGDDRLDESAGQRAALGDDLRILARRHPRATWAGHANLGQLARFWLQRHEMFRRLDEIIRSGTEAALERRMEAAAFNSWLSGQLGWLLWQLEEHHQVEDHHYFPLFRRAAPRLAAGFELLERDHVALHAGIGGIIGRANAVLAHEAPGRAAFRADLARFRDAQVDLGRELIRHLADEEDLVIPLLLERGEEFLLGGA
jgi:iron-sulfur cluster repair protein YtfE (RIC family)